MVKKLLAAFSSLLLAFSMQSQSRVSDIIFEDNFENTNGLTWNNPVSQIQWQKVTKATFPKDNYKINIPLNCTDNNCSWMMLNSFSNGAGDDLSINSRLTSPKLDLSNANEVFLKFDNLFRKGQNDHVYVEVSTDNKNWIPIELYADLAENEFPNHRPSPDKVPNPFQVVLDLSAYLAKKPNAWVAFRYEKAGGDYGNSWQIDNIEIWDINPKPKCNAAITDDFYSISPNLVMPKNQIEPIPFLVNVENKGSKDLVDVKVEINIYNEKQRLFHDELIVSKLKIDASEYLRFNKEYLPDPHFNKFIGEYKITPTCTDEIISNNAYRFKFELKDNIFQKEDHYTLSNAPEFSKGMLPKWEWGNFYNIKNGKDLKATAITFGFVKDFDRTIEDDEIFIKLFEWDNKNKNQEVEPSELTLVGQNGYTFTSEDEGNIWEMALYDPNTNTKSVALKDSTTYFAVVEYVPKTELSGMRILANDTMFYLGNQVVNELLNRDNYTSALKIGNEKNYSINCFNYQMVPVIRLNVENINKAKEVIDHDNDISIFPNPASSVISIYDTENQEFSKIKIQNLLGQTLYTTNFSTHLDISFLENGIYNLILEKENSLIIKKINIVK
jgi:hypothetical protein